MKVKVMYTVQYEEVPSVVNELVEKCRDGLKKAAQFKFDILDPTRTEGEITALQEKLSLISVQLEDCLNLSRGYLDVKKDLIQDETRIQESLSSGEMKNEEGE